MRLLFIEDGPKDPLPSTSTTLPPSSSTPSPSTKPIVKAPPNATRDAGPKAPPPKAKAELEKLRPFLRFSDGGDSDAAGQDALPGRSVGLPPQCLAIHPSSLAPNRGRGQGLRIIGIGLRLPSSRRSWLYKLYLY